MCRTLSVLAFIALSVGLAHSFSWDIVVAKGYHLEFYYDGSRTYSLPTSRYNNWVTYDPLHNRVLFAEKNSLSTPDSFNLTSGKRHRSLIKRKPGQYILRLAYDPATELLFAIIEKTIYSYSIKPGSNSEANLMINLEKEDSFPSELVVDSCRGYIYWTTYSEGNKIERARFDGSEREVILDGSKGNNGSIMFRQGLTIDPQTQKIYWIKCEANNDDEFSIESVDLNGKNARTLYREIRNNSVPTELAISKDFIYWADSRYSLLWQLPKNPPRDADFKPKQISLEDTISSEGLEGIATNYKIIEQTQGMQNCKALKRLLPNYSETNDCSSLNVESLLCVHGTKISGESRCECTQGYSGERCDVSVCHNYCFQGDCSATAEGEPTCRCDVGYSGQMSEVDVCFNCCLKNGACSERAQDVKPLLRQLSEEKSILSSVKN